MVLPLMILELWGTISSPSGQGVGTHRAHCLSITWIWTWTVKARGWGRESVFHHTTTGALAGSRWAPEQSDPFLASRPWTQTWGCRTRAHPTTLFFVLLKPHFLPFPIWGPSTVFPREATAPCTWYYAHGCEKHPTKGVTAFPPSMLGWRQRVSWSWPKLWAWKRGRGFDRRKSMNLQIFNLEPKPERSQIKYGRDRPGCGITLT